jgi:hypothetical protein
MEGEGRWRLSWFGRPSQVANRPTLAESLVGGSHMLMCVHWRCPMSIACSGGPIDPCEAERHVMIGRSCFALDLACPFYAISAQIHLHTYLD